MRTLKKTLCLVLAVVMVLGLGAFSVSANSFKDTKDSKYTEAIDVLEAIGVLEGYEDGSLKPTQILQRQDAASMIVKLMKATSFQASHPFTDVPEWLSQAVGYMYASGITDGATDTTFEPESELTGLAFGKFLLGALGYDAELEGMTGSSWQVVTAKLIRQAGLDDGLKGVSLAEPITREVAAQLALNTLKATEVEYGSSLEVGSNGTSVRTSMQASRRARIGTIDNIRADAGLGLTTYTGSAQFAEDFFPDLTLRATASDDFGRPAEQWQLGAKTVSKAIEKTPVAVYTDYTETSAIRGDIDGYDVSGSATLYTNTNQGSITPNAANINAITATGRVVELYATNLTIDTVVVIDTVAAKINSIDTINKVVTLTKYYNTTGASKMVNTGNAAATSNFKVKESGSDVSTNDKYYSELAGLAKNDYVLLHVKNPTAAANAIDIVEIVGKAETVTGKYTGSSTSSGVTSYTIGGTVYKLANELGQWNSPSLNDNLKLVLDEYGNVLSVTEAEADTKNYAFLLDATDTGNPMDGRGYYFQMLFTDGSTKWVETKKIDGNTGSDLRGAYSTLSGNIDSGATKKSIFVSYTAESDGTYSLSTEGAQFTAVATSAAIKRNDPQITVTSGGPYTITNSTTFLVYNSNTKAYDVYIGTSNLPASTTADTGKLYVYCKNGTVADIVVIKGEGATNDVVYIYDATVKSSRYADSATINTYDAIVDGELKTIEAKNGQITGQGWYVTNTYKNGYINAAGTKNDAAKVTNISDGNNIMTVYKAGGTEDLFYVQADAVDEILWYSNGLLTLNKGSGSVGFEGLTATGFQCWYVDWTTNEVSELDLPGKTSGTTPNFSTTGTMNLLLAVNDDGYIEYAIVAKTA